MAHYGSFGPCFPLSCLIARLVLAVCPSGHGVCPSRPSGQTPGRSLRSAAVPGGAVFFRARRRRQSRWRGWRRTPAPFPPRPPAPPNRQPTADSRQPSPFMSPVRPPSPRTTAPALCAVGRAAPGWSWAGFWPGPRAGRAAVWSVSVFLVLARNFPMPWMGRGLGLKSEILRTHEK